MVSSLTTLCKMGKTSTFLLEIVVEPVLEYRRKRQQILNL